MGTGEIDLTMSATGLAEQSGRLVDELEGARATWSDLPFLSIHSVAPRPGDVEAALAGTFRHHDERFALAPPIDWWDEPYRGANERGFFQNSFVFADPLLADPRFEEVLLPLAEIFTDWLGANPRNEPRPHPHRYAWHDHAAAGRVVAMAFVLREGIRRGALDRAMTQTLASGVLEHIRYLLADENYAAHNNHGFASDAAIAIAARSLAPAGETGEWAEVAERRFAAVLDHMIDREEALHLEHSPYYHWIIQGALARFAKGGLFEGLDLADLTQRMEESGAWLVAPDGTLPPFGDTPMDKRPPRSAASLATASTGMKAFPAAGYAVVKSGESALIVTAAHHPTAHKHADDGSFCLYDGGRPIVLDSGNPGYEYGSPAFDYGTSPAAHATISVDGFDWTKGAPRPYGSGIVAAAETGGLYALLTRNPNAAPDGGGSRRVLVYSPARFLLVIDDVEASADQRQSRHIPLAPELAARLLPGGAVEISDRDNPIAEIAQVLTPESSADGVEIAFGKHLPGWSGFSFPDPEHPRPSCDVTLSGPGGGQARALAVLLGRSRGDAPPAMTWSRSGDHVFEVEVSALTASTLRLRVGEDSVALDT
jgi:Heparinase II/III-like protein/Heparinase II/III N-terminus